MWRAASPARIRCSSPASDSTRSRRRELRQGMGAILFVPDDDDGGRTVRLRELCVAVGVEVVDFLVARCSEAVRPLISIVPAQRLAGEIARLTGGDPDRSRNPV